MNTPHTTATPWQYEPVADPVAWAKSRGAQCDRCPLNKCGRGPVPDEVKPNSKLVLIGEAPGENEVMYGRPFVGKTGEITNRALLEGGLYRENGTDVSVTNTILCQPPPGFSFEDYIDRLRLVAEKENREFVSPVECCAPRLQHSLNEANSTVEYALGKQALASLARHHGIPHGKEAKVDAGETRIAALRKQHGAPIPLQDSKVLIASYHPAFAMRSKSWMPVVKKVIRRAARIAVRGGKIDWSLPPFDLDPSVRDVERFADDAIAAGNMVEVDIETGPSAPGLADGGSVHTCVLRTVGWGFVDRIGRERIMVIPVRSMTGKLIGTPDEYERKRAAFARVAEKCKLGFQNGQFDTAVLLRLGWMTDRKKRWLDCYLDSETEFLTEHGWRRYDDVEDGTRLGTINSTGGLEWQEPTDRIAKTVNESLFEVETRSTRCVVTRNHRMFTRPLWRATGRHGDWGFTPVSELLRGAPDLCEHYRAPASVPVNGEQSYSETMAHLIGLFISDGSISFRGDRVRGICISQIEGGRAEPLLTKIQKANEVELRVSKQVRTEMWRTSSVVECTWRVDDPSLGAQLLAWCGRYSQEMRLPPHALTQPYVVRRALMLGLVAGDGVEVGRTTRYSTTSAQLASDVHALAVTLGWVSSVHRSGICWVVHMRPEEGPAERVSFREKGDAHVRQLPESECRVVCFSVPNKTLVTRCRGRVAFHGNCMIAHHNTENSEQPHDLGYIMAEHFEAPLHKADVDVKSVNNVDYPRLKEYNARDVLGQLRAWYAVQQELVQLDTIDQFKTDTALAPVFRDMGELGLVIDEPERQRLKQVLSDKVNHFRAKFRYFAALIHQDEEEQRRAEAEHESYRGKPIKEVENFWNRYASNHGKMWKDGRGLINPNSVYQLRTLLFDQLDLTPVLNTDGYDFNEEDWDDPSTSTAAILKLQEKYPHICDIGDALLEFRAFTKLLGTYVADKKGRIVDVDWTKYGLPPRPDLRLLHTTYKIHVIPSGRVSTQPAIQNWPAVGKANMRTMVVSPPGHTIVGADYDQVELRIYAVVAQDQLLLKAFSEGLDPHSLNAASLLARNDSELMDIYWKIYNDEIEGGKKYWRSVAKRFCVPCYTRVLTQRGEVPIVDVRSDDLVWDGVEWVTHDGVIFNGYQEVITYDGLTATPDHKVWRVDGTTSTLEQAALDRVRLARSGADGQPIRFLDHLGPAGKCARPENGEKTDLRGHAVHMRNHSANSRGCSSVRNISSVHPMRSFEASGSPGVVPKTLRHPHRNETREARNDNFTCVGWSLAGDRSVRLRHRRCDRRGLDWNRACVELLEVRQEEGHAARPTAAAQRGAPAVSGRQLPSVQELRSAGNRVSVQDGGGSSPLGGGQLGSSRKLPRPRPRPNRQRWALRTGKSPVGNAQRELAEQASGVHRPTRTLVAVYDILNAGPRHRFTANDKLISNCYLECYGGEESKLFSVMAASRNKATGERDFPNLKESEVHEWHERWHRLHPETKQWQNRCKKEAYATGQIRVGFLDRRARFWPGGIDKKNAPPNHTIQGAAGSIMNRATLELSEAIPHREWSPVSGLFNQCHDYIAAYVPRDRAREAVGLFRECMEWEYSGIRFTATPEVSYRWSDQG